MLRTTFKASSFVSKIQQRTYAVVATQKVPTDTSQLDFPTLTPSKLESLKIVKQSRIIQLLKFMKPVYLDEDFVKFAKSVGVVETQAQRDTGVNLLDSIKATGEKIAPNHEELVMFFGENYNEILDELFTNQYDLEEEILEKYLQMNEAEYKKVPLSRSERILDEVLKIAKV